MNDTEKNLILLSSPQIKSRLLKLIESTQKRLEKHNIPYTIFYGTLLGAVRHKGFIPWDDDIDVIIDAKYIDKLKAIFSASNVEYYDSISNENYFDWVIRISDPETIVKVNEDCHQANTQDFTANNLGLCIDIYPYYHIPSNYILRKITLLMHKVSGKIRSRAASSRSTYLKKVANTFDSILGKVKGSDIITKADYSVTYPYNDLIDVQPAKFEHLSFDIPKDSAKILKIRYGDWEKLPTEEEKASWIHYENTYLIEP